MATSCRFCQIIDGTVDAHRVYVDRSVVAFLDANPAVRGHVLIVPRQHRSELLVGSAPSAPQVFEAASRIADGIDNVLEPDGFSCFYTTGALVGTVDHAHVHLLPRWRDDDVRMGLTREELDDETGRALSKRIEEAITEDSGS